jgi:hypothetical protein
MHFHALGEGQLAQLVMNGRRQIERLLSDLGAPAAGFVPRLVE